MEYFGLCLDVAKREMKKFNLDPGVNIQFVTELTATSDVNFDVAYNRVSYMYKCATSNLYFIKHCISQFVTACPDIKDLISSWKSAPDSSLCSMSCGPGLDYLAFMSAFLEHGSLKSPTFNSVNILSPCGAWRNTVGLAMNVIHESGLGAYTAAQLNYNNVEVIQGDLFKSLPDKCLERLGKCKVALMMRTLNLVAPAVDQESSILKKLMELIFILKPGTTVFCIDTKPSVAIFEKALSKFPGKFLYQTAHFSERLPGTFPEEYIDQYGCLPVVCARGAFFVWQKLSSYPLMPNCLVTPLLERCESMSATNTPNVLDESILSRQHSKGTDSIEEKKIADITETIKNLVFQSGESTDPSSVKDSSSPLGNNSVLDNTDRLTPCPVYLEKEVELKDSTLSAFLDKGELQNVEKSGSPSHEGNISNDSKSSSIYTNLCPSFSSNCNSPIVKNAAKQEFLAQQSHSSMHCDSSIVKNIVDQGSLDLSGQPPTLSYSSMVKNAVDQESIDLPGRTSTPCNSTTVKATVDQGVTGLLGKSSTAHAAVHQGSLDLSGQPCTPSNSPKGKDAINQRLPCQKTQPTIPCTSFVTQNTPSQIFLTPQFPLNDKKNNAGNSFFQKPVYNQAPATSEYLKMMVGEKDKGGSKPNNPSMATESVQTDPIIVKKPTENATNISELTERIRNLVAHFESEVTQPDGHVDQCGVHHNSHHAHDRPNRHTCGSIDPSCFTGQFCDNGCNNLRVNSSFCDRARCRRESGFPHCNNAQVRCCCSCRRNYDRVYGCSSPCHSHRCFGEGPSRCYAEPCREQSNPVGPNIVIPLQNISDDILSQFILALKASSKPNK